MTEQTNELRTNQAYDRIQRASESIQRAASIIASLQQTKKVCKKCHKEKDADDFGISVTYIRIKSGELKAYRARRHTCYECYRQQSNKAKKCSKKDFNFLF